MTAQKDNASKPNGFGKKVRKETVPDHITNPVVDTEEDPTIQAELKRRLQQFEANKRKDEVD